MNTQWLSKTFNWLENELREIDVLKFRAKMKPVSLEPKNRNKHLQVLGFETVNHRKEI